MINALLSILNTIAQVGAFVEWAIVTVINSFLAAIVAVFAAALAVLPGLPSTPAPPSFVTALNWFFPVGGVVSIAAALLTAYAIFFAVRWVFKKVGVL